MSKGRSGPDGLLIFLGIVFVICIWGPVIALSFRMSIEEMFAILAPIVLPIVGLGLAVLLFRNYWSRW